MSTRKHIPLRTKLAAALCSLVRSTEDGKFVKVIPHEEAKRLTEEQVFAKFEWNHHPVPKAFGGPDEFWNLDPMPKAEHREITAKVDIPRIAKAKRVAKREASHSEAMTMKSERRDDVKKSNWPKGKGWPKRPFPKKAKKVGK